MVTSQKVKPRCCRTGARVFHTFLYRCSKAKVLHESNATGSYRVIDGQRRFEERLKVSSSHCSASEKRSEILYVSNEKIGWDAMGSMFECSLTVTSSQVRKCSSWSQFFFWLYNTTMSLIKWIINVKLFSGWVESHRMSPGHPHAQIWDPKISSFFFFFFPIRRPRGWLEAWAWLGRTYK